MNKKGTWPIWQLVILVVVIALIVWYIFFGGVIGAKAGELLKDSLK